MMKRTKLEQYVLRALIGESFSMGEIMRGMPLALHGRTRGREWKVDEYRREQLLSLLEVTPRSISREHTERGLTFFRSLHRKLIDWDTAKYPEWRADKRTKLFSAEQMAIVDDFSHFMFCGYYDIGVERKTWNYRPEFVAMYHVFACNGAWFTYTPLPWQRSSTCCIIH